MMADLEHYIVGENDERLSTDSSDDVRQATQALARGARRSLLIFSQQLDSRIYNTQDFCDELLRLATSSRRAQVFILIQDANPIVKHGSRVVELSHRISSRLKLRKPPIEYQELAEEFVIADERAVLHRHLATRYEGELCFNSPLKARQLTKLFMECWEKSAGDPQLRRLYL